MDSEQDPERGRRVVNATPTRGGRECDTSRWTSPGVSPSAGRLENIVLCGSLLVLFLADTPLSPLAPAEERVVGGKGEGGRETLKRGGCDYEGGDAATSSYSRVERGKAREEGIRPGGRTYVTTTSLCSVSGRTARRAFLAFSGVSGQSSGRRANRDKTNLDGSAKSPDLPSRFFVFLRIRRSDGGDGNNVYQWDRERGECGELGGGKLTRD